jgi:hypothetical protein
LRLSNVSKCKHMSAEDLPFSNELHLTLYNIPASKEKPFKVAINSKDVINLATPISANAPEKRTVRVEKPKFSPVHNITIQILVYEQDLDKFKLFNLTKGGYYFKIFLTSDNLLAIKQSREEDKNYSTVDKASSAFLHLSPSRKEEINNLSNCLRKRFIKEEDYLNEVNRIMKEAEEELSSFNEKDLTEEQKKEIAFLRRYVDRKAMTESEFIDVRTQLLNCYKDFQNGKMAEPVFKKRKARIIGELDWEKNLDIFEEENRGKPLPKDAHLARFGLIRPQTALDIAKETNTRQFSPTRQDVSTNSISPVAVTVSSKSNPSSPVLKKVDLTQHHLTEEEQVAMDQLIELKNLGVFSEEDFQNKKNLLIEKSKEAALQRANKVESPVELKIIQKAKPLAPAMAISTRDGSPTGVVPVDYTQQYKGVFKGHFLSFEEGSPVKSAEAPSVGSVNVIKRRSNNISPVSSPTTKSPMSKGISQEDAETLKKLHVLKEKGVITQEDFDAKRKKILFAQ